MKLIFCPHCHDVVKMRVGIKTFCECGKSWGAYTDNLNAVRNEQCIPLGFTNGSLVNAINHQPEEGLGKNFEAFIIPKNVPSIRVVKDNWDFPELIETITKDENEA